MLFNLGSINIDHIYRLPHLPRPGETLAALTYDRGLGGKGANQSVAALKAGARVAHIGAIGPGDTWIEGALAGHGLSLDAVARVSDVTGHAIIALDAGGENSIILHPGANRQQDGALIARTLARAGAGDALLLQNETSHQAEAAALARAQGADVFYSAAPFDIAALRAILPHATHLLMNAVEAAQLAQATGQGLADLPVTAVIVTRGADGADWIGEGGTLHVPAFKVTPVDTTGAGDCFAGSLAARLSLGDGPELAMRYAAAAAALQVTRLGTAAAMPTGAEVRALLAQ